MLFSQVLTSFRLKNRNDDHRCAGEDRISVGTYSRELLVRILRVGKFCVKIRLLTDTGNHNNFMILYGTVARD